MPRRCWIFFTIILAPVWAVSAPCAEDIVPHAQRLPLSALPITARIKVPPGPAWLETGFGSLWVTKIKSKEVLRIDPGTNTVIATIRVGSKPELGIAIGLGYVWIADTKDKSIKQIDPNANLVVRTIAVNLPKETEGSIGVGEQSLWALTNEGGTDSGTLSRINPMTGEITANIQVNAGSHSALVGFLAADESSVWVMSQGDGSLARIDPTTNQVAANIEVGVPGEGGDLSIGENYVWVAAEGVPLSQVDPRTNRLVRQFAGGKRNDTLRVGLGSA